MCNFWSALITRSGEVIWDRDIVSHEELVKKTGLKDDKLKDRDFVRIEITPNKTGFLTMKKKDWVFKVDEKGTLPDWYIKNQRKFEAKAYKTCFTAMRPLRPGFRAVAEAIDEIKAIRFFSFDGKVKKEWHLSVSANLDAARDAAGDAAWDAAGDAALYVRVKFCVAMKAKLDAKHIHHAEARMAVWKAGYGLRCDVNGKLFVYGVKKVKAIAEGE